MPAPVPTWATVVPGQYDTAALFNAISAGGSFLTNPPILLVTQTAAQSIPNAVLTNLGFDSTLVDSYAGHSNVTNNSRYTPTAAGWYLLLGAASFASNSTGGRDVEFHKNGATINVAQGALQGSAGGINTTVVNWAFVYCNGTTDYVELAAYQTSGGALNTVITSTGMAALFIHA